MARLARVPAPKPEPADPELTTRVVEVTPKLAEAWLTKNTRNRRLDQRRVAMFADSMRRGQWTLTHQGIAFATDGTLTDGQHRLAAVIESGATIPMMVTDGMDHFTTIDIGKNRTMGDILGLSGVKNGTSVAAALRLVWLYDRAVERPWGELRKQLTVKDLELLAIALSDDLQPIIPRATNISRRIKGSPAAFGAALYICWRWAARNHVPEFYDDWATGLETGVGMDRGDPRLALASWISGAGKLLDSSTHRTEVIMMLAVRGFHAYVQGQKLDKALVRDTSTFLFRLPGDGPTVA